MNDGYSGYAKELGTTLMGWVRNAPYFFKCSTLKSVFVHAGFVPGVDVSICLVFTLKLRVRSQLISHRYVFVFLIVEEPASPSDEHVT